MTCGHDERSRRARVADSTGNWVDTHRAAWSRPYSACPFRPSDRIMAAADAVLVVGGAGRRYRARRQIHAVLFSVLLGAFVMRGAGCTWNDITDRDLDARVERTRSRPIPAGQVSVTQALAFLVLQALIGLAVLLQFNRFAIVTGIASLVIVVVYPFMKRIT